MKYFVIIMTFVGIFLFGNQASAMWISSSSEQLLEQSGTIFVGSITDIAPIEVEYQSQIARNGTIKQSVGPESMTLDEYTVHVEKFLQGPQNNDTINLLQATVGGVPGGPAKIGGFKVGDRVLFYVPKYENQTHLQGQYLPESFKIPEYCDAQIVLKEPNRITEGPFIAKQDGVKKKKEFTADIPIQFSYQKNVGLTGEGFDVIASIVREDENKDEILFDQKVHAESETCKWLATAKWSVVPPAGNYRMSIGIIEDGHNTGGLLTSFVVNATSPPHSIKIPIDMISPLKQSKSGIPISEIQCREGLELILKSSDDSPVCVSPETKQKLIQRGWAKVVLPSIGSTIRTERHDIPVTYSGPTDIPSANNQFALRFYSHISQDDKEGNIFFSPTSILTAFAIAYEGAQGNTATEMEHVFGFDSDDSARHEDFANMQQRLNFEGQNNTLSIANALWLANNFEPYDDYVSNVENYYSGKVESVDFASKEKSLDIINQWVHDNTSGKIEKIFETLDPQTNLAITNAIYFKGMWEEPFEKDRTAMASFHVGDGLTVSVPMMELKTTYLNQTKTPTARILELPYEGNKISMLILLPNEIDGIHALENSLSTENIDAWQEDYTKIKTKAYIPKFKLETDYDLIPPLVDLGVRDAFGNADFSGISELDLFIYKAAHKAIVEVNEEGTEAAAATGIAMLESGPVEFRADHPFVFVIQDNETGQILFMGRVTDPTK